MENKPAFLKGFLWFAFSGTAMLSAFILPVHLWALSNSRFMNLNTLFFRLYFFVLFIAALYHGLYRTKTILFDIGLIKYQKTIGWVATIIFLFYVLNAISLLFLTL